MNQMKAKNLHSIADYFRGGEMACRINRLDWSQTSLGEINTWSQSLKSVVKMLLASSYPMILTWGKDFIQIYNDAYSQLIGDKHPAALGIDIRITLAEAWDTLGPMIETVMATGVANWTPALLLLLERSGYREESYFNVSHAPAEDDSGEIVGMLAVCSEVTQQVLGDRRLRLLRDLSSKAGESQSVKATCLNALSVIASSPIDVPFALLYLRDLDGKKLTLQGVVGILAGEAASLKTLELETNGRDIWSLAKAANGETILIEAVDGETTVLGGTFSEPVKSAIVLPLASSFQTETLGVLVAGISPSRELDEGYRSFYELLAGQVSVLVRNAQAYEEERRRAEALAELDRAKTEFFNNVSHEFRTPLTLMLGPLEDVLSSKNGSLTTEEREQLQLVHRNSLRLLKLVNTLLDFSRIEASRIEAVYEPTDLAGLTTELASVFRSAIERAGLRLTVDCPPLPEAVYVDRQMWEKIVLNLLNNAFKFTFTGEITVALRWYREYVELEIRDTGTGIPAAELPRLFERFYRVQGLQGRTHEGSGIGLSLVQELVRLHGGSVRVTSKVNQGSSFIVVLPTGKDHLPVERIGTKSDLSSTAFGANAFVEEAWRWLPEEGKREKNFFAPAPEGTSSKARILLADDNADMRDYLKHLLQPDYEVEVVTNGVAALAAAERQIPDLVLSDIMMPGVDGLQLLRQLRSQASTREVPIILVSARAGEESRVEGLEMGADDYLIKPFSARELLARVRANLELSRLRKQAQAERAERIQQEAARVEAEVANRMKDEFLQVLSHEIRTPLNGMLGWVKMLSQGKLDRAATARALETIERNAKAQAKLVDDLLDVSRIIRGELRLEKHSLSLISVIKEAIETVRPQASGKDITIECMLDECASCVFGDASRLQQVVWNLLTNAVKFTPSGGRVEVSLETNGSDALLQVRDTGIGIKADFLPHIFDRFRQADTSTTRTYGGLGLGLAIVRHLMEMHQGTVQAHSPGLGLGTTFSVQLPLMNISDVSEGAESISVNNDSQISLKGLQVLVVDDEDDGRELVSFILQQHGALVTEVASVAQVWSALESRMPHILISDLGMPEEDGYSLIRRIRALPVEKGGRMPAIALSAYAKEEDRRRALLTGFQMYLSKPFDPLELVVMVASLSGRFQH
ncbi:MULTISPECIES: ATP-binding protein [unclassified Nostoc]|uniref:ATP-binding protein n=1 Tax=unclassified Nostoc TaxID=2593658 RepID=UPI002ADC1F73|nr:ATP-binding protein [Nostoc sp. DedQUE02]